MTNAHPKKVNNGHAEMLKRSSFHYSKSLGTQNFSGLGSTIRFKLQNSGYITGFTCKLTLNTTIATATATLSPRGIWAFLSRIRLTDYAQVDRHNMSGFQLFCFNSSFKRHNNLAGMPLVQSNTMLSTANIGLTTNFVNPAQSGAIGTNNHTLLFYVPVCYDFHGGDLRGMMNAETNDGEAYLSFEAATALWANGSDDYMFNGAATSAVTFNSASIEVIQHYYYPQTVRVGGHVVLPKPERDLLTIFELSGNVRSSDNLASGSDRVINLNNNRDVRSVFINYQNNGVLGGSSGNELAKLKFAIGGANYPMDVSEQAYQMMMFARFGNSLPKGAYVIPFDHGIKTTDYGSAQILITPGGTVTGAYIEVCQASFYHIGQHLGGISQ